MIIISKEDARKRGTFVGGKSEGYTGHDPLVPGLYSSNPGVTGLLDTRNGTYVGGRGGFSGRSPLVPGLRPGVGGVVWPVNTGRGTYVGGKGGGYVGREPLVPGLHGPFRGVTGLNNMAAVSGTYVGGKNGGFTRGEPLVPTLHTPHLGVTGLTYIDISGIKQRIKHKFINDRIDIMCEGLMLSSSGLAKAMRHVTYGLDSHGCNIRAIILDGDDIGSRNTNIGRRVVALSGNGSVGNDGGSFYITMNTPLAVNYHPGFYNLAYIMFETLDFPQIFVSHLKNIGINEIWTPSHWGRDSMIRAGLGDIGGGSNGSQIKVMPLGVDTGTFSREYCDLHEPGAVHIPGNLGGSLAGKFIFLSVGTYSERKGISTLIRAFVTEFGLGNEGKDYDKVALFLKGGCYDPGSALNEMEHTISGIPGINDTNRPYVAYDFNVHSDEVMASLYKGCDAFVLPSRGEGYGLPYCEAMSMGLPTIGTRWGGNLEFMNNQNSYLIDVEGFTPEPRCDRLTPQYKGQLFAVPSVTHLRKILRHVYENQDEAKAKGRIARNNMVGHFDWSIRTAHIRARLEEIARG